MAEIIKFPKKKSLFEELKDIMAPLPMADITQQYQQIQNYYPKVWHKCKAGGVTLSQWQDPGICPFCGEKV